MNNTKIFFGGIYNYNVPYEYKKYICILIGQEISIYSNKISSYEKIKLPNFFFFIDDTKDIIIKYNNGNITQFLNNNIDIKLKELDNKINQIDNRINQFNQFSNLKFENLDLTTPDNINDLVLNFLSNDSTVYIDFNFPITHNDNLISINKGSNKLTLKQNKLYTLLFQIYFNSPNLGSGFIDNNNDQIIIQLSDNNGNNYETFLYIPMSSSQILNRFIEILNPNKTTYNVRFKLNNFQSLKIIEANILIN